MIRVLLYGLVAVHVFHSVLRSSVLITFLFGPQYYFPERLVGFEAGVGGAHVFEGEGGVEDGAQPSAREERDDLGGEEADGGGLLSPSPRPKDSADDLEP